MKEAILFGTLKYIDAINFYFPVVRRKENRSFSVTAFCIR